jgi:hypothetical protein
MDQSSFLGTTCAGYNDSYPRGVLPVPRWGAGGVRRASVLLARRRATLLAPLSYSSRCSGRIASVRRFEAVTPLASATNRKAAAAAAARIRARSWFPLPGDFLNVCSQPAELGSVGPHDEDPTRKLIRVERADPEHDVPPVR